MVFCSIVLKVKRIHKIVISSCFAAYKMTNWSWHQISFPIIILIFSMSMWFGTESYTERSARITTIGGVFRCDRPTVPSLLISDDCVSEEDRRGSSSGRLTSNLTLGGSGRSLHMDAGVTGIAAAEQAGLRGRQSYREGFCGWIIDD